MKKGFTLIELLVVVLIIGILAAIALPQYTKAVERSRSAEAVQALGDLATAQSIYYMTNNSFADSLSTLNNGDITIATPTATGKWTLGPGASDGFTVATGNASVTMSMTRNAGMYNGAVLSLTVANNGAITKTCTDSTTTTGFCALVSAAGYTTGS